MLLIGLTFLIGTAIVIGTDMYLADKKGFDSTLSYWLYVNSIQYPIIPWAIGLVMGLLAGHFFWDQVLNVTANCASSQ